MKTSLWWNFSLPFTTTRLEDPSLCSALEGGDGGVMSSLDCGLDGTVNRSGNTPLGMPRRAFPEMPKGGGSISHPSRLPFPGQHKGQPGAGANGSVGSSTSPGQSPLP